MQVTLQMGLTLCSGSRTCRTPPRPCSRSTAWRLPTRRSLSRSPPCPLPKPLLPPWPPRWIWMALKVGDSATVSSLPYSARNMDAMAAHTACTHAAVQAQQSQCTHTRCSSSIQAAMGHLFLYQAVHGNCNHLAHESHAWLLKISPDLVCRRVRRPAAVLQRQSLPDEPPGRGVSTPLHSHPAGPAHAWHAPRGTSATPTRPAGTSPGPCCPAGGGCTGVRGLCGVHLTHCWDLPSTGAECSVGRWGLAGGVEQEPCRMQEAAAPCSTHGGLDWMCSRLCGALCTVCTVC